MNKIYQKSPGGNKNAGFTLIELLVVVLIIGILSAVALPQYEMAVEKARFTQAVSAQRALINAEQIYFMANGSYTSKLEDLDITFANNTLKDFGLIIHTSPSLHIEMKRNKKIDGQDIWMTVYLLENTKNTSINCSLLKSVPAGSKARRLCKSVTGAAHTTDSLTPGYEHYSLQ